MSRTGVYVLGMHRSGTSATTRLIHLLGVPINVPDDWLAPAPDNPKGYWESAALVDFNDELLTALGGDPEHPPALPRGWQDDRRLAERYEHARELFPTLFPSDQWVWKDPRLCLTFPFWRQALDVQPVVVLAYRHPLEVARSYHARNGISIEHGLALWERYVIHSLRNAVGLPAFVTSYDDMMQSPHAWCLPVRDFLTDHGLATTPEESWDAEIDAFIDPALRHSAHTPRDLTEHSKGTRLAPLLAFLEAARGAHARFELPAELASETGETASFLARLPKRAELQVIERRMVSVVIPADRCRDALGETCRSLADQSYAAKEVVVVRDGPCALDSDVPTVVIDGVHGGPSAVRNTGVAFSRGEFLLMLEPGDRLESQFIERCVEVLEARQDISIVYGDQRNFGGDSSFRPGFDFDPLELTRFNAIGSTAMVRRTAWDATGGCAPLEGYEDWDFWLACAHSGHLACHVPGTVLHHRVDTAELVDSARDQRLKARVVLNHPRLYGTSEVEWAAGVLAGDPQALAIDASLGVVPQLGGVPPAWSGWRFPELRRQAVLVLAEELVADRRLPGPLAQIEPDADVTIVLARAIDSSGTLVDGLEEVLWRNGFDGPLGPHVLVTSMSDPLLAQQVDAIFTFATPPLVFSGLMRLDGETMRAWRVVAPAVV